MGGLGNKGLCTFLGFLGEDVLDIVLAVLSEDLDEVLSAFETLSGKAVGIFAVCFLWGLLAVADYVDSWVCLIGS